MRVELYNPSIFKEVFDCISHIVDECKLEFSNFGLTINALDKSHITFISLDFKYDLFDTYEVPENESVLIDTVEFIKVLKRCKNDEIMRIQTDNNNLILTFEGESTRKYNLRLIDNEYETPKPPSIDYPLTIEVPSNLIKDTLSDMKLFSENFKISVDEDYLRLYTEGMKGATEMKYLHGSNIQQYVESGYSIEKFVDIFRASKLTETVELGLGNDLPVTITFKLVTGDGQVSFLLAPRLEAQE
jgi:proliferating cell nuclear antigen